MTNPAPIPAIDVHDADARRRPAVDDAPAALIVDVRERHEFIAVRVDGVALLPMSVFAARHGEIPRDRPILVMCATGGRSAAATAFLLRAGWPDVSNVAGGIEAWERAGLPVRRGPVAAGEGDLPGA
jgi:rhodanese-related sulfurtransferase